MSTRDQNTARQEEALKEEGCDRIFIDKASGRTTNRPQLKELMLQLREGDELVVLRLSRFARSVKDLLELIEQLKEKKVHFKSLKESITIDDTAFGKLVLVIFAGFSQFESDLISERTKEGLAVARAEGRVGGRPKGLTEENEKRANIVANLYNSGYTIKDIREHVQISPSTIYKYLRYKGVKIASKRRYKKRA